MNWFMWVIDAFCLVLGFCLGHFLIFPWMRRRKAGIKRKWHRHSIDELKRESDNERARNNFSFYRRYFFTLYEYIPRVDYEGVFDTKEVWSGHIEVIITRWRALFDSDRIFSSRLHIGNAGSETPWDGHLIILGTGLYWSHSGLRKLAERLSRCSGYAYDTREYSVRIISNTLWVSWAEHSDMCRKPDGKKRRRRHTWRSWNVNLSVPQMLFGPIRNSWDDLAVYQTLIRMPEGSYAVILTLVKNYRGRTKISREKHEVSYHVNVDAPKGIPTHVDHSGGWKGDRTYGVHVAYPDPVAEDLAGWEGVAEMAVQRWVTEYRERTGFVKPDPVDA